MDFQCCFCGLLSKHFVLSICSSVQATSFWPCKLCSSWNKTALLTSEVAPLHYPRTSVTRKQGATHSGAKRSKVIGRKGGNWRRRTVPLGLLPRYQCSASLTRLECMLDVPPPCLIHTPFQRQLYCTWRAPCVPSAKSKTTVDERNTRMLNSVTNRSTPPPPPPLYPSRCKITPNIWLGKKRGDAFAADRTALYFVVFYTVEFFDIFCRPLWSDGTGGYPGRPSFKKKKVCRVFSFVHTCSVLAQFCTYQIVQPPPGGASSPIQLRPNSQQIKRSLGEIGPALFPSLVNCRILMLLIWLKCSAWSYQFE